MDIKPITTFYKGYRFRSRLEARWAVFFDALGINWEYEPEGFSAGKYGAYLPDFRIDALFPPMCCEVCNEENFLFVDIKPDLNRVDADKLKSFTIENKCPLIILDGLPDFKTYSGFCPYVTIDDTDYRKERYYPYNGRDFHNIRDVISGVDYVPAFAFPVGFNDGINGSVEHCFGAYSPINIAQGINDAHTYQSEYFDFYKLFLEQLKFVETAINAAKSARFEYGECGAHRVPA